ncbi:Methyltransferase-like protein 6 [Desmophyllum pertusum]|uniref:Methyltransferase-like protein 6 n=1 Tax=Desmophyllum pertusum TaxID=174260 RepID=A0A9W9ZYH8_9CNID|nr:Methyltransferase-like protein 6 [Desmophyllum pertusum]
MADEVNFRVLTEEEKKKVDDNSKIVSDFKQNKLEKEAQKNWDLFYKRNTTNFFKDRHWTTAEFKELLFDSDNNVPDSPKVVLEAGCGVGNLFYPLLEEIPNLFIHACDFSKRAVQFVKRRKSECFPVRFNRGCFGVTCAKCSVDIATLVFVLSAIHPEKMLAVLQNVIQVKIPLNTNLVETLFHQAGFQTLVSDYAHRRTVNKKEGVDVPRIFVQAKFIKPRKVC